MLLHQHHRTLAQISSNPALKYLLRDYFDLPRTHALTPAMLARGLGQADLVLALLRIRDSHASVRLEAEQHIASLIGHPIAVCPSCLLLYRTSKPVPTRSRDERRITYVAPENPRRPKSSAHALWPHFVVGRTVGQLYVRGVTKRDVRRAVARGWIQVEELA